MPRNGKEAMETIFLRESFSRSLEVFIARRCCVREIFFIGNPEGNLNSNFKLFTRFPTAKEIRNVMLFSFPFYFNSL